MINDAIGALQSTESSSVYEGCVVLLPFVNPSTEAAMARYDSTNVQSCEDNNRITISRSISQHLISAHKPKL